MLMLIAADMWQQKGNGIVHDCLLHVFYIVGYPTLSILVGLLFGEDSLTEAGFPLSVNLSSFSSAARCVTCVCPYVRSLANAIAMQLRNSNVNSCELLPKQAKQALNFSPRKVSFSLHNEQGELNIAHIRMPNESFLFLTKLADMKW